jgi:hypothetical protein
MHIQTSGSFILTTLKNKLIATTATHGKLLENERIREEGRACTPHADNTC